MLLVNIRDDGDDSVSDVKNLDVYDVETCDDIEALYWKIQSGELSKYKTLIMDTVTMWQQMKIEEIVGAKAEKMGKQPTDWGVMKKQEWGQVSGYLKTWITNFRDLDMEVVFIAQDRAFNVLDDDDDIGELDPEVGPSLSPATKSHLCAAVSVIGHTFVRSREVVRKIRKKEVKKEVTEYCLRLGPSASYITKFRKPKKVSLPDFLIDPNYEEILETIKGDN